MITPVTIYLFVSTVTIALTLDRSDWRYWISILLTVIVAKDYI